LELHLRQQYNYLGRSGYAALDSLESGLGKEVTNLLKSQDDAEGQVAGGAISDLKNIWKMLLLIKDLKLIIILKLELLMLTPK
jgi:hypothetical protein